MNQIGHNPTEVNTIYTPELPAAQHDKQPLKGTTSITPLNGTLPTSQTALDPKDVTAMRPRVLRDSSPRTRTARVGASDSRGRR
jgi:hypothetical protein